MNNVIPSSQAISIRSPNWYLMNEEDFPVCTFIPEVLALKKVLTPAGELLEQSAQLRLHFRDGSSVEISVLTADLDKVKWSELDHRCILNTPHKKAQEYIANIISAGFSDAKVEIKYRLDRMGIHHIGDDVVFAAGDRVITRSSVSDSDMVYECNQSLFHFDIDPGLTAEAAVKGMKELIDLSPEIGRTLVAHVLSGIMRMAFVETGFVPRTVLVVVGKSGMLKSTYITHLAQIYNRGDEIKADTRFNSTERFIEDVLCKYSECTAVLDDIHTGKATGIKKNNENVAEAIIRQVGDDIMRGRKAGNAQVQKKFLGNVVFISEYRIGKESTIPRILELPITRKPEGTILYKYQQNPLLVSTFYYYFIQWYVDNYQEICKDIADRLVQFRETAASTDIHGRLDEAKFYLKISYAFFLEFCKYVGLYTTQETVAEYRSFAEQLSGIVREQQHRYIENMKQSEEIDYLEIIRKLYKKGKFHIADNAKEFSVDEHDGVIHNDCLCLRGERLEKALDKKIPHVKFADVIQTLGKQNVLRKVKKKNTIQIKGKRFYAVWLDLLE